MLRVGEITQVSCSSLTFASPRRHSEVKTAALGNFLPPRDPNNSLSPGDHGVTPKKVPHGNAKPGPFTRDRVELVVSKRSDLERQCRELHARDSAGEGSSGTEECDECDRDADQEGEHAGLVLFLIYGLFDADAGRGGAVVLL